MHTIIHPRTPTSRNRSARPASHAGFRQPHYDCREQADAVKLLVYMPGVSASGVEIESRGPDLVITAHKAQFIRVNFEALHLESAQRDYRLRLRLGSGLAYTAMQAEIRDGVLSITLPKLPAEGPTHDSRLRRVA